MSRLVKAQEREAEKEVMIVYAGDIAYLGEVDPKELDNPSAGVTIHKPLIVNVRPITSKEQNNQLEAVVLDIMLPIEFAGIPLSEQFYTGFLNFIPTVLDLDIPNSNISYMNTEQGRLAINKLASIADRTDPQLRLFNVTKTITPCQEIVTVYRIKMASYNELLYSKRAVDMSQPPNEQPKTGGRAPKGNVIDLGSTRH